MSRNLTSQAFELPHELTTTAFELAGSKPMPRPSLPCVEAFAIDDDKLPMLSSRTEMPPQKLLLATTPVMVAFKLPTPFSRIL